MPRVTPFPLPEDALLQVYARQPGCFTDCFAADAPAAVPLDRYVEAFYTTWLFKLERWVLSVLLSTPATDAEAARLARADTDRFAVWTVEDRTDTQILLTDSAGRTRSWLMVQKLGDDRTRLLFGSAVLPKPGSGEDQSGDERPGMGKTIMAFHRIYSVWLLRAARARALRLT